MKIFPGSLVTTNMIALHNHTLYMDEMYLLGSMHASSVVSGRLRRGDIVIVLAYSTKVPVSREEIDERIVFLLNSKGEMGWMWEGYLRSLQ